MARASDLMTHPEEYLSPLTASSSRPTWHLMAIYL